MNQLKLSGVSQIVSGIVATYIGTVVGAGFASGREIMQFFTVQGAKGCLGVILSVLLMGLATAKIFKISCAIRPESYKDFLQYCLGRNLSRVADIFLLVFFIILIGVMLAGAGSIFADLGFGYWTGVFGSVFLLFLFLFQELPGLIKANLIIIPLMFVGALGLSVYAINCGCVVPMSGRDGCSWLLASLQFASYNLVLALPVLISLSLQFPFVKLLKASGWLGSLILGIMTAFIHWALLLHLPHLRQSALPMISIAKSAGSWVYLGYTLILWGEMLTTLLANTYGIAVRLVAMTGWPYRLWLFILAVVGIVISKAGFISLIANIYPFYGFVCIVILLLVLAKNVSVKDIGLNMKG